MFNNFFCENPAVYEIAWKIMVEPGWPQITIWHVCIACWRNKARNTLAKCNTHFFVVATTVALTRVNVKLYVQCLSFLKYS